MKEIKVKNLDIQVPKGSAFAYETPKDLPKLHQIMVVCAKKGSGKTVAIVNLFKRYQEGGALDRLFIVSPTFHSNREAFKDLKFDENDVYENANEDSLDSILEKLEQEATDYEEYHESMKEWKKLHRFLKGNKNTMPDDDQLMMFFDGEHFQAPTHKWGGKKPVCFILFDDIQGSPLFRPKSKLSNLVIKHRHTPPLRKLGGSIGCSLFFCIQSYKSNNAGIPRCIRGQACTMLVWKTKDEAELKEIADECSGEVGKETFMKVYEAATEEPHSFLFIDFHKKKEHPSMFRKRFDTFLIPDDINKEK